MFLVYKKNEPCARGIYKSLFFIIIYFFFLFIFYRTIVAYVRTYIIISHCKDDDAARESRGLVRDFPSSVVVAGRPGERRRASLARGSTASSCRILASLLSPSRTHRKGPDVSPASQTVPPSRPTRFTHCIMRVLARFIAPVREGSGAGTPI